MPTRSLTQPLTTPSRPLPTAPQMPRAHLSLLSTPLAIHDASARTILLFHLPALLLATRRTLTPTLQLTSPTLRTGKRGRIRCDLPSEASVNISLNEQSTCKAKRKDAGQEESCCPALLRFRHSRECSGQQGDRQCLPPHPPGSLFLSPKRRSGHRPPSSPLGGLHFGGTQRPQLHFFIIMNEAL